MVEGKTFDPLVFEKHMIAMAEREKELAERGIKVFRASTTEVEEFLECRRKWNWSSLSRLGLEPKKPHAALSFGITAHKALEEFYKGRMQDKYVDIGMEFLVDWRLAVMQSIYGLRGEPMPEFDEDGFDYAYNEALEKVSPEEAQGYNDLEVLGIEMMRNYEVWSNKADYDESTGFKRILYTEKEFAVPMKWTGSDIPFQFIDANEQSWELWLVGRLDLVVEDFAGRIWVLDHKTSKDRLDEEILILDDQMTKYLWAAEQILQWPVEGVFYNVLRKKLPTVPKVLVSGKGLSKDKSMDTTYEVYLEAILANGFKPDDYEEYLEMLQNKKTGFFERVKVRRNNYEIITAGIYMVQQALDMLNVPLIYPHFTWDCKWKCDFKELCAATNRNDDTEWMLQNNFRKREFDTNSVYLRETTIE